MGMFDYLLCELPLPKGQDWLYQTKDTQEWCEMKTFVISKGGRLLKKEYDTEETPEDELPYKNEPEGSILRLYGSIRKVAGSDRSVDQEFDGDLLFYPDISIKENALYRATFRNGTCVEICFRPDWDEGPWSSIYRVPIRGGGTLESLTGEAPSEDASNLRHPSPEEVPHA